MRRSLYIHVLTRYSSGPLEYSDHCSHVWPQAEDDGYVTSIYCQAFDPISPIAGFDIFLWRQDDCSGSANSKNILHRQVIVRQLFPEVPGIDDRAIFDAVVQGELGSISTNGSSCKCW
jgi:hypothetical protein